MKYGKEKTGKKLGQSPLVFLAQQFREACLHAFPKHLCRGLFYQLKTILHILVVLYINFSCKSTTHFLHGTQVCSSIFFLLRYGKAFFFPFTRLMQMFSADALLKTHARKLTLQFCKNLFRTK